MIYNATNEFTLSGGLKPELINGLSPLDSHWGQIILRFLNVIADDILFLIQMFITQTLKLFFFIPFALTVKK